MPNARLTVRVRSPEGDVCGRARYRRVLGGGLLFPLFDTPEVYFGTGCYGRQASATTKRLLPEGTRVRLLPEPATDRVDDFGRLLRYVVRAGDAVNVNLHLVRLGAAAPYFNEGRRGKRPLSWASRGCLASWLRA